MKKFNNVFCKRFGYFNVYVIKGAKGDILIDTGFIGIKRKLKKWLDKFDIKLIILTHAHVDHIWNVAYIKSLYDCEVALGIDDIENLDNTKIITKPYSNKFQLWSKIMSWGMKKFKQAPFEVDYLLRDNDVIDRYGIKLKIISLPGHTNGSIGILYDNYLFCGDALVNRKLKMVEIAYQNQDNMRAEKSVHKILEHRPNLIFMGHDKEAKLEKLENLIKYLNEKNIREP